jgi:hypothetical protein
MLTYLEMVLVHFLPTLSFVGSLQYWLLHASLPHQGAVIFWWAFFTSFVLLIPLLLLVAFISSCLYPLAFSPYLGQLGIVGIVFLVLQNLLAGVCF